MKVTCISKNRINHDGLYDELKVGQEYTVLAIEVYDRAVNTMIEDFVIYRIKETKIYKTVIMYPAKLFKVTDPKLSSRWIIRMGANGLFNILPKSWARDGFWEDYYNDVESALQDFKKEEEIMLSE